MRPYGAIMANTNCVRWPLIPRLSVKLPKVKGSGWYVRFAWHRLVFGFTNVTRQETGKTRTECAMHG